MKKSRILIGLFLILGLTVIVWAFSGGPPDGRAGNPPVNATCKSALCHNSFDLNSGDGSFSIDNVPINYVPGNTYTITITLMDPGQSRWGTELTVMDNYHQQAGTIVITDPASTQLSDNTGTNPDYIKHTLIGNFTSIDDGPVSWTFDWIAPDPAVGNVTFYASGNAANNDRSATGDYIYTATDTSFSDCDRGDTNGDGNINVLDVLAVANHIIGLMLLPGDALCRADCDANSTINVLDALGIANVIIDIIDGCPP